MHRLFFRKLYLCFTLSVFLVLISCKKSKIEVLKPENNKLKGSIGKKSIEKTVDSTQLKIQKQEEIEWNEYENEIKELKKKIRKNLFTIKSQTIFCLNYFVKKMELSALKKLKFSEKISWYKV